MQEPVGGGVLDSYTLDLLGDKRRGEYGRYRLWLAVSWGVANAVMGKVAEVNFNYNFICFGALSAVSIVTRTLRKALTHRSAAILTPSPALLPMPISIAHHWYTRSS